MFKSTFTTAFFISLAFAIGFIFLSISISHHTIEHFDRLVISFIRGWETPTLTNIMKYFTTVGSMVSVLILSIIALFFIYQKNKQRSDAVFYMTVLIGNVLLNQTLKAIFRRARPDLHRLIVESGYSFPSGHSMTAFSMYGAISFLIWKHIPSKQGRGAVILLSSFMILAIGVSRIYLGVHYPSDVLGSYLFSGFWLTAAIWFYQRYKEKYNNKRT
ncbi:MAG TPA: phosphatase PAP2 family protein [Bacillota bacterium]|nr:phosphatase PAP2 family protein [Bacillota bacterium]